MGTIRIRCGDADCVNDLHCYQRARKLARGGNVGSPITDGAAVPPDRPETADLPGRCRECGIELVDWQRVHDRDECDLNYTIEMLQTEKIRHHFWHEPFDEMAVAYARRKGRLGMHAALENRIRRSIGPAEPYRDGTQTPFGEDPAGPNVMYFAQHATATCCRRCVELWHGIPMGRELTDSEVSYLLGLAERYVQERIPDLAEEPVRVARVRPRRDR